MKRNEEEKERERKGRERERERERDIPTCVHAYESLHHASLSNTA